MVRKKTGRKRVQIDAVLNVFDVAACVRRRDAVISLLASRGTNADCCRRALTVESNSYVCPESRRAF
jgi:hypothetical protein